MHTRRPFAEALNQKASDEVAVIHYEWIKAGLLRGKVTPSPYNIALAWNAGVSAVLNGKTPAASHAYAKRVSNLTTDQMKTRRIASVDLVTRETRTVSRLSLIDVPRLLPPASD